MRQALFSLLFILAQSRVWGETVTISCVNQKFVPHQRYIACLYSYPIAKALRQTLNAYLKAQSRYENSEGTYALAKLYLPLFSRKFVALEIWDGDFGGHFVTVAMDPERMRFLRLWIYKIDGDDFEYQIREAKEISFGLKEEAEMKMFLVKECQSYWQ